MSTILKWAGNKTAIMPELLKHLPAGSRLVEPFAGSCAVMMATDYPYYLVADINPDLINLYQVVINQADYIITEGKYIFETRNDPEAYYKTRHEFNLRLSGPIEHALYFLYLNRHGYRGLCRYNLNGYFNVPYGNYKKPYFPENEIRAFAEKAQHATFICASYEETLGLVSTGDVVYCDPPYHGTFTSYHSAGFNEDEQHSLASLLLGISEHNPVIVSNSDTLFTRSIFREYALTKISAARSVGVAAGEGKHASEIIAVRCPVTQSLRVNPRDSAGNLAIKKYIEKYLSKQS